MTHLAAAEVPGRPGERPAARPLRRRLRPSAAGAAQPGQLLRHLPRAEFGSDLARPGAALYGVNPTPGQPEPDARRRCGCARVVLQVRDVPAGDAVGYNGTWTAARPSRIATVSVGYADGYPRSLSNGGGRVL